MARQLFHDYMDVRRAMERPMLCDRARNPWETALLLASMANVIIDLERRLERAEATIGEGY